MKYNFNKDTKIYVAGHKGLIGSAFIRFFKKNGYKNIVKQDKHELDLTCKEDTINFFRENLSFYLQCFLSFSWAIISDIW